MQVVTSDRRRRTASAGVRDGQVVVRVPAHLDAEEQERLVETLVARLQRRARSLPGPVAALPDAVAARRTDRPRGPRGDRWLVGLADEVGARWLDGRRATRAAWSSRMTTRWASCTITTGHLRVSDRLADAPTPVVAHVLLHELAHLEVRGHGPAFARLLARDPLAPAVAQWLDRRSALETAAALRQDGLLGE